MTQDDFAGCVIVMAHPDDEILWASALVAGARKIILCYTESADSAEVTQGRRQLLQSFPVKTVISLDIPESGTYQSTDWTRPVETPYGIACSRNRDRYARNFHRLVDALSGHLAEDDVVVTHNPWGEYGHEEHIQVYRAVCALKQTLRLRLFVSGYASDRILYFMQRTMPRLGRVSAPLLTDKALAARLKAHYQAHRSWTWDDHYDWPDHECFYEIAAPDAPLRPGTGTLSSRPVNVIWLDGSLPAWRRLYRSLKRRWRALIDRGSAWKKLV
ncbi:PIG-L family deacetylase [Rhizobium sp. SSA_523]|uniref:PIG-L family deacetylase n=1 Tax=Rhizobium sp. SSA_523 TaxID=2952477 RepID=UPI002091B0F9|nr:PIG-L family deacetylase [Rhizobium sp. SSA_523]MCO5734690.1 PIG-L family deacetylase [Rhizobium sp. SSA_523]WKC20984.1 PIG-L family deacetylase [Rhizobium sp. SSA_523]